MHCAEHGFYPERKKPAKYELIVLILPTKYNKSALSCFQYNHKETLNEILIRRFNTNRKEQHFTQSVFTH